MGAKENRLDWIDLLRFPLMIGVVFVHAYDSVAGSSGGLVSLQGYSNVSDYLMFTISQVFSRLSVPIFFVFAGYFLAVSFKPNLSCVLRVFRRRVDSLVVPYLFWNFLVLGLLFFAVWVGVFHPAEGSRLGFIAHEGFASVIGKTLGVSGPPLTFQFWFIRDLFLSLFFIVPLMFLGRYPFLVAFCVAAVIWFLGLGALWIPSGACLFFVMMGVLFSMFDGFNGLKKIPNKFLIVFSGLALSEFFVRDLVWYEYYQKTVQLVGVLLVFQFSVFLASLQRVSKILLRLAPASFFLFAFHDPLLYVVKKVTFGFVSGPASAVAGYFFCVIAVVIISVGVYFVLLRLFPRFLLFITGGR